jgi:amino acid permease
VLALPIIYQRTLGNLRYISLFIVAVISYTIIVTAIEFPSFFMHYHDKDPNYKIQWIIKPFDMKWFQGWATMLLSFYGQLLFFFMRGELMNKTEKRMDKLINSLSSLLIVFFCAFSIIGYLSVGDNYVPDLFTLRKDIGIHSIT